MKKSKIILFAVIALIVFFLWLFMFRIIGRLLKKFADMFPVPGEFIGSLFNRVSNLFLSGLKFTLAFNPIYDLFGNFIKNLFLNDGSGRLFIDSDNENELNGKGWIDKLENVHWVCYGNICFGDLILVDVNDENYN